MIHAPVSLDLQLQPFRQGIHHRNTDPVKPSRNFIGPAIELSSGMQYCQNDLGRRFILSRVHLGRDAPAIVYHGDTVINMDDHLYVLAIPAHRLIHTVVYDLIDQVMKTLGPGISNVHRGSLPDGV